MKTTTGRTFHYYTCDQCERRLVSIEDGGFHPIELSGGYGHHYLDDGMERGNRHFCSSLCLLTFIREQDQKLGTFQAPTFGFVTLTEAQSYGVTAEAEATREAGRE